MLSGGDRQLISPGVYVHGSERKDTWSVIGCYRQSTVTGRAKNLTGVFSGYSLTGLNSILVGKICYWENSSG